MTDQLAARAVAKRRPIIAVVMKQVAHLERVARTLHDVVFPQVKELDRTFHLLVVDDEADDSSIDESDLTQSSTLQERQVPRRIVDLWESRQDPGETAMPQLFATYLAYTATPQANFLQDQSNPLAPKDFVVCLRTPGADGDPERREPSYRVPEGLPGWYTGGDVYYRTLDDVPLCMTVDDLPDAEQLAHGVTWISRRQRRAACSRSRRTRAEGRRRSRICYCCTRKGSGRPGHVHARAPVRGHGGALLNGRATPGMVRRTARFGRRTAACGWRADVATGWRCRRHGHECRTVERLARPVQAFERSGLRTAGQVSSISGS